LLGAGGECRGVLVLGEQVGRVLGQLRDGDEAGEVAEVGAFIVELDEAVVLSVVSLAEGFQGVVVASGCIYECPWLDI